MKLTLKELFSASDALKKIGEDSTLDITSKYSIFHNIGIILSEFEKYDALRKKLIKEKYGIKLETGEIKVLPEKEHQFLKELEELQSVEIDLDIRMVGESVMLKLSSVEMYLLKWMIDFSKVEQEL